MQGAADQRTGPRVAVVIATRDRRDRLLDTVARIRALPERPLVLVADDGSSDGSVAALHERFGDDGDGVATLILGPGQGAAARNAGVQRLTTPYVALSDDDSWWDPGALAHAVELFDANPRLGLIAADVVVGPERRPDPTCRAMRASPHVLGFLACGAIVRREAFLAAGGFHRRFGIGGEEQLLAIDLAAAGWELRHVPAIVAHHCPAASHPRPARIAQTLRNDLWTIWLRRPARHLPGATARRLRRAGWRATTARGLLCALRGTHWVATERRPIPAPLAAALQSLER